MIWKNFRDGFQDEKSSVLVSCLRDVLERFREKSARNSSFELGSAEYSVAAGIPYSAADFTPVRAERDASTRIHGQYSLHFPNPRGNTVQFSSHDVKLIPGRSYVFSCWMKAEKPAVVQLMLRSCTRDAKRVSLVE
ncbi:MAG: hypothetical protein L6W00_19400 [Lentisphaeria bacterium]|nr:MAG: hypothetical protein L6W00_19400 [Lentisphaeria bacterium]